MVSYPAFSFSDSQHITWLILYFYTNQGNQYKLLDYVYSKIFNSAHICIILITKKQQHEKHSINNRSK